MSAAPSNEQALIGGLLLDPTAIIEVVDFLKDSHFENRGNGLIYKACLDLYEDNKEIDITTVSTLLGDRKHLGQVGGMDYLQGCIQGVPTATHVKSYAENVLAVSKRKGWAKLAEEIKNKASDKRFSLERLVDYVEEALIDLGRKPRNSVVKLSAVMEEIYTELKEGQFEKEPGVLSGFDNLDNLIGGLFKGDFAVMAGRPGMGKTTLALNCVMNMVKRQKTVLFFNLEVSRRALADKLIASEANIKAWNVRTGKVAKAQIDQMKKTMDNLQPYSLFIDDSPAQTIGEIKATAKKMDSKMPLDCIVVDYLQMVRSPKHTNRVSEMTDVSSGLKSLARELDVPVLALAQLSRRSVADAKQSKHPNLHDIRDSGSIEQDADLVMMLYRDDAYYPGSSKRPNTLDIFVRKHRNGPTGMRTLYFNKDMQRFVVPDESVDNSTKSSVKKKEPAPEQIDMNDIPI